ncbi:MAG: ester cyclase [Thermoleophilia bacterium]|jgi:steroid delta-isomerase-like uncharacterized protein
MSIEHNKEVARRFIDEIVNAQQMDVADELLHPEYILYFPGASRPILREDLSAFVEELHSGFPDFTVEIKNMIAEGDMAAMLVAMRGTHEGTFQGLRPTEREIDLVAQIFIEFIDGKIRVDRPLFDQMELLLQLGTWDQSMRGTAQGPFEKNV